MISHQSKDNPKNLTSNGYQSLSFNHPSLKISLISFVHHTPWTNHVDGSEVHKLPQNRSTPFGNMARPFVLSGTDLEQTQTGQLKNLRKSAKFTETPSPTNETSRCDLPNPFYRKNRTTVRNLLQKIRHLLFQLPNKPVTGLNSKKNLLDLKKDSPLAFLNPHRLPTGFIKGFGPVSTQSPTTDLPHDRNQGLPPTFHDIRGRGVMSQKILRSFGLNILHHSQKLRKENKYQGLDLIIKNRASLKSSLPGMSQSPKLCRNPLRNHHRQSMAQFDDIRNHLGILAIRLTRRVSLKFFQPLRVQRIDLYQLDSFLHQIMDQRFSISSRRFEPHYDLSQMIRYLRLRYSIPKLIKSLTIIQKFKGFYVHPIGTSPISHIRSFCKIHSNQKRFFIDDLTFSCFNSFHGYTPFFDLGLTNLQITKSIRKSIASFVELTLPYIIASSPIERGGNATFIVRRCRRSQEIPGK